MSNEAQYEHIENKMKEAAKNNNIVFEENAWVKMEALLDKQRKRKPFFWFWLFVPLACLIGAGIFLYTKQTNITNHATPNFNKAANASTIVAGNNATNVIIPKLSIIETDTIATQKNITTISNRNSKTKKQGKTKYAINIKKDAEENEIENEKNITSKKTKPTTKVNITSGKSDDVILENNLPVNILKNNEGDIEKAVEKPIDTSTIYKEQEIATNKTEKKEKKKILTNFYLLASAGADNGSVKLLNFKHSNFTPKYGIGIGYNFNKKISLQTGYYVATKKYTAAPADYNVKEGSYLSQLNITKVDAACLIYEIPITIRYNFLFKKTFCIFTTAGLSSYIMKNEDYIYFYKRYYIDYSKAYTYNDNQHFLSNANFSLGLEKSFTKSFSILFEPIISLPIKGVGEGSVKLFSSTLQMGIKYQPFHN